MNRIIRRVKIAGALCLGLLAASSLAADLEHAHEAVDAQSAKELQVALDFGAGHLSLKGADQAEAAILDVDYNPIRIDYKVDYRVRGDVGYLDLESILKRKRSVDTDDSQWDLVLSNRYPTELELKIGASDAELDLGGLNLREISLDLGAASGEVDFSTPNPGKLEQFDIDAGAASLECRNLGNANFEDFSFSGGAGSFELDFRGQYTSEARVNIEVGLGSIDITLPANIPVRIKHDDGGWLSSVNLHGGDVEELDKGLHESPGFDDAKARIIVSLEVGLGSADIYFRK